MGLKKGMTNNITGRPVGALNKVSRDIKQTIHEFLQNSWPDVVKEFHAVKGRDKLKFYNELLSYVLPKMRAVELSGEVDFNTMSENDIDRIAQKLYKNGQKNK